MSTGTKTLLFGYHAIWLHWWFVLRAWIILYGRPKRWWEYVAIFVHDIGYFGSPNIDGEEGARHPLRSADWFLFLRSPELYGEIVRHSRHTASVLDVQPSRLCVADKLAFLLYPDWLLDLTYRLSGERDEYVLNYIRNCDYSIIMEMVDASYEQWAQRWTAHVYAETIDYMKEVKVWSKLPMRMKLRASMNSSRTNYVSR